MNNVRRHPTLNGFEQKNYRYYFETAYIYRFIHQTNIINLIFPSVIMFEYFSIKLELQIFSITNKNKNKKQTKNTKNHWSMNENKQTNNSKYASAATSSRTTHPKPQPNKIKILYEKATDPTQNKSVRSFYQSAIGDGRHLVQQQLHYCYCFSTTTYLICISSSNKNYKNQARTKAFSTCTHSS